MSQNSNQCLFCQTRSINMPYCCKECNINGTIDINTDCLNGTDTLVVCYFELDYNNTVYSISYYLGDNDNIELIIEDFTHYNGKNYFVFQTIFNSWDEIWSPTTIKNKLPMLFTFS